MTDRNRRIILWGGSFNPPTLAHKALADFTLQALHADEMQWIVCPHNILKDPTTLAPFEHRFRMVEQILAGQPAMRANDIEQRQGSSLTVDTVRTLRRQHPDDELLFMMGSDNWLTFHEWGSDVTEIFDFVSIVIMWRPGYADLYDAPATRIFADKQVFSSDAIRKQDSFFIMENPLYDMSATQVRQALATGDVPDRMVAAETLAYIRAHHLYEPSR